MKSDEERSWSANRGYDDSAGIYYSYDSNVPNSIQVSVGDIAVVRTDDWVAGWGLVEHIEMTPNATKEIRRCPNCQKTRHRSRLGPPPSNICDVCKHVFSNEETLVTLEPVTNYRAYYANTWTEAARPIDLHELATIQRNRGTFNAIRPIEPTLLPAFLDKLSGRDADLQSEIPIDEVSAILGGHTAGVVRRRRGQRAFRFELIRRYGEVCAFSGLQPPQVLEAAHLYSYAERAEHRRDGGLLLRRDYHALFDAKLVAVNPSTLRIEIASKLHDFPSYTKLDGLALHIDPRQRPSLELLGDHYDQATRIFTYN
ncbi:MAG: HNH endonuclease signature motif containing protein [Acidimicrobiales bacterium]